MLFVPVFIIILSKTTMEEKQLGKLRLLNKYKLIILAVFVFCFSFSAAFATNSQTGTSGGAILKLDQSVKASALGGSFVALADDPTTIFYNPAGLLFTDESQLSFAQNNWLLGTSYSTLCYSHSQGKDALGLALSRISFGEIQETTGTDRTGTGRYFSPGSLLCMFSWARDMRWAYVGASAKILQQNLDTYQENGLGLDAGLLSRTPIDNLRAGASILNLGTSGGNTLPLTLIFGLYYDINDKWSVLGDLRMPRDNNATIHLGGEYTPLSFLTLRGGISSRNEEGSGGNYSLGLGLHFGKFNLDYAYVPYAELGDTHRVGITLGF
jgi:hypothetical protein